MRVSVLCALMLVVCLCEVLGKSSVQEPDELAKGWRAVDEPQGKRQPPMGPSPQPKGFGRSIRRAVNRVRRMRFLPLGHFEKSIAAESVPQVKGWRRIGRSIRRAINRVRRMNFLPLGHFEKSIAAESAPQGKGWFRRSVRRAVDAVARNPTVRNIGREISRIRIPATKKISTGSNVQAKGWRRIGRSIRRAINRVRRMNFLPLGHFEKSIAAESVPQAKGWRRIGRSIRRAINRVRRMNFLPLGHFEKSIAAESAPQAKGWFRRSVRRAVDAVARNPTVRNIGREISRIRIPATKKISTGSNVQAKGWFRNTIRRVGNAIRRAADAVGRTRIVRRIGSHIRRIRITADKKMTTGSDVQAKGWGRRFVRSLRRYRIVPIPMDKSIATKSGPQAKGWFRRAVRRAGNAIRRVNDAVRRATGLPKVLAVKEKNELSQEPKFVSRLLRTRARRARRLINRDIRNMGRVLSRIIPATKKESTGSDVKAKGWFRRAVRRAGNAIRRVNDAVRRATGLPKVPAVKEKTKLSQEPKFVSRLLRTRARRARRLINRDIRNTGRVLSRIIPAVKKGSTGSDPEPQAKGWFRRAVRRVGNAVRRAADTVVRHPTVRRAANQIARIRITATKKISTGSDVKAKGWFRRAVRRVGNALRRAADHTRRVIPGLPRTVNEKRRDSVAHVEGVETAMSRNQIEQSDNLPTYYDSLDKLVKYKKNIQKIARSAGIGNGLGPCHGQAMTIDQESDFTSPNYPEQYENNATCTWKVIANPGETIQLVFSEFEVEENLACSWDVLKIYDGPDDTSPMIGYYCGESLESEKAPRMVVSMGSEVTLVLETDGSETRKGFVVSPIFLSPGETATPPPPPLPPTCGETDLIGESSGVIKSPNFPNDYPEDFYCEWSIKVPSGFAVLTFHSFKLEGGLGCVYDYVKIFSNLYDAEPLQTLCRGELPDTVISSSVTGELRVVFRSDSSINFGGFNATFSSTPKFINPLPDDMAGYGECGGTFTNSTGLVHSPRYEIGGHYPDSEECEWIIESPDPNMNIYLDVLDMRLERCGENCACDKLLVYNGIDAAVPLDVLCGNDTTAPGELVARGTMKIIFRSDFITSYRGFDTRWRMDNNGPAAPEPVTCGGQLTLDTGTIKSPGFDSTGYGNYTMCEWQILPPSGEDIVLYFPHFKVEQCFGCSCDSLKVYDGLDSTEPVDILCGNTTVSPIHLSADGIVLRFETDQSVTDNGFEVAWMPVSAYHPTHPTCGRSIDVSMETADARTTVIQTPGFDHGIAYMDDTDCFWEITTGGLYTRISIVELDIESCGDIINCGCDRLEVFETEDSVVPKVYCGENRTDIEDLLIPGGYVKIHFHSDYSVVGQGFKAVVSAEDNPCNGTFYATTGSLSIDSSNYIDNLKCITIIEKDPSLVGEYIHFQFDSFDVEDCPGCSCDRVEIYEHVHDTIPCAEYCGGLGDVPYLFVPYNDALKIRFVTDGSVTKNGFSASWMVGPGIPDDSCPGTPLCSRLYTMQDTVKEITTPGFDTYNYSASYYPDDLDCEYEVIVPPGERVRVTIEHFNLEQCGNCSCDYMQIITTGGTVNGANGNGNGNANANGNANGNAGANSIAFTGNAGIGLGTGNGNGVSSNAVGSIMSMNGADVSPKFCGEGVFGGLPRSFMFDSTVIIKFVTDYSVGDEGFKITYDFV